MTRRVSLFFILWISILLIILTVFFIGCTPAEEGNEEVSEEVSDVNDQAIDEQQVNEQESLPETEEVIDEEDVILGENVIVEQEEIIDAGIEEEAEVVEEEVAVSEIIINNDGFSPNELTVKIGDKVKFVNNRAGNLKKAMVNGNRQCVKMKSPVLNPGDTFEWTFEEAQTCTVVDAITITQIMTITVIE